MRSTFAVAALMAVIGRCSELPGLPPLPEAAPQIPRAGTSGGVARPGERPQPAVPDAGVETSADAGDAEACAGPPGLYADATCEQLAGGVEAYTPQYELWADFAQKQRHIYLPSGSVIDTSMPDRWNFPVGTRVYKTFLVRGLKLETRVFEKLTPEASSQSWSMVSYVWSADQRSASLADANGVADVLGTQHDIPSQMQCRSCHTLTGEGLDAINGFGAVQLNHDRAGWTLQRLIDAGVLVNVAGGTPNVDSQLARVPGGATAQAALGYLHGNCGHCHGGPSPRAGLHLWLEVGTARVEESAVYRESVCQCLTRWKGRTSADGADYSWRIVPGDAAHSGIVGRMAVRGKDEQMPPLATDMIDPVGVRQVGRWIAALSADACPAPTSCSTPEPAP
jgi:hypothetical protein